MKLLALALLLTVPAVHSQTNSVISTEKPSIVLNFTKNESGEVVIKVSGHSQPLEIQFNSAKTSTVYVEDSAVNLSQLGFESAFLALDTAGGKSINASLDTQAPATIPPVLSKHNPPLATPY